VDAPGEGLHDLAAGAALLRHRLDGLVGLLQDRLQLRRCCQRALQRLV
jgi:hypothetical protein